MSLAFRITIVSFLWLFVLFVVVLLWRRMQHRSTAMDRLRRNISPDEESDDVQPMFGWLQRKLALAGYSQPLAAPAMIFLTLSAVVLGVGIAFAFRWSGGQQLVLSGIASVPGGLSGMLAPVVIVSPWLIAIIMALVPTLMVRASRRRRVAQVSRDLPLALDLWATLSEGGLGYDAALDRWLKNQDPDRVLASACRGFQRDLLGGMRRSMAFRRLSARLEVPPVTRFTAAMIQSEQMGSSVSETLRMQAEDVRAARREKSLAFAQSLATKRVIPLVVCFLPGLFVWPLGPFFTQLLRIVDSLTGVGL